MVPGSVGWAAVGAVVIVWDVVAIRTQRMETLSGAFLRGCSSPAGRAALTAVCVGLVLHLERWPEGATRFDPLRIIARRLSP